MSDWSTHSFDEPPEEEVQEDNSKATPLFYIVWAIIILIIIYFVGFGIYCGFTHQDAEQGQRACQEIQAGKNQPVSLAHEDKLFWTKCEQFGTLSGRFIGYNKAIISWFN